jgi:hypothetical protein
MTSVEFSVRVFRHNYHSFLSNSKQIFVSCWLCLEFKLSVIAGDQPHKDEKLHTVHTLYLDRE